MNLIRASLRYPQVTLVIVAMLASAGLIAVFTMPRREDPKITIRTGLVTAVYPGATSKEVEAQVTHKIEERLFAFTEVRRAKTFSTTRNGLAIVNVELNESVKDAEVFWSKLRLSMAQLKSELPDGVQGPSVDSDFGDTVAVLIAVHSNRYGYRDLKQDAERIEAVLRALPAVSKIERIGDQKELMEVTESQQKLSQYSIDPQHVVQALEAHSDAAYAGRIPTGESNTSIDARGRFHSEDDIRNLVVDVTPTGIPVHLGDLASVQRVYEDPSQYVRINGQTAILLAVQMHESNNIVTVGRELQATLDRVQRTLPPDVQLDLIANQPRVVSERIGDFFREFGIAIVAVILVTMLLLPMRVALVAAVAIPVTVSITFALLDMIGVELQQVSIAALIVVLGMVVDDAIVIADNYVELLDRNIPRDEAAWRCASEMAAPVFTATITIISSFAPLLLIKGSTGEFIRALPIAVSIALATSFVVAMLLTPLTARYFIHRGIDPGEEDAAQQKVNVIGRMQQVYNRAIGWSMQNRRLVLVTGVAIFLIGLGALQLVRQQFFPLAERDQFVLDVWLPEGSRIQTTDAAVRRIEQVIQTDPMIRNYTSFLGSGAPRFYYDISPQPPAENYAQILINTHGVSQTPEVIERLRKQLPALVPDARILVKELQQGDDMEAPVEVRISGSDDGLLRASASRVEDILRNTPGARYIHTDWHEDQLQTGVHLNDEVTSRMGFTNANVARQLAAGLDGAPVAIFWEADRALDITLRSAENERSSFQNLADVYVQSPAGASIPLRAIATLTPELALSRIVHRNGVRTITVRCFAADGYLPSQVLAGARKQVSSMSLPDGYRIEYGGEDESQQETSGDMTWALVISLILIFLILLLQFRTFIDPLIVMAAFPLALPGAALGLLVTHNPLGFTAFVGIISLGGLVVRNSIILIDAIYERMKAGVPLVQAAMDAGERRLRPIFLTTMAAAVGVIPMIVSGSSLWSPLASVIAFGLLVSMFFTLLVIPVLFVAVHGNRAKFSVPAACVVAALMLFSGTSQYAQAQTRTITLDEAIQRAQQANRLVRMAHLKVAEERAKVTQVRADYFPRVTNESNALYLNERQSLTIPQGALGSSVQNEPIPNKNVAIELGRQDIFISSTTAVQPLSQLFKIGAGVDAAQAGVAQAQADARRVENDVTLNVKKLYYKLLAIEQRRKAAESKIQAVKEKQEEARNAVASGTALNVEVQQETAETAEAQIELGTLEDNDLDLKAELSDLMGSSREGDIVLEAPEDEASAEVNAPTHSLLQQDLTRSALAHNPEIDSAHSAIKKAQAGLSAARLEFVPDVSLYAQHVYQNGVPLLPEDSGTVGLRLEWTLSEFGKRSGQIRERNAQLAQAQENLRQTESHVQIEIEKTLRKLRRSTFAVEAAQAAVAARTEMQRITADQVTAKTAVASALSDANYKLAEAKTRLFEEHAEHVTAQAELDNLLGR